MSATSSKIVFAVGITALLTAIVLIAAFVGFLYLRDGNTKEPLIGSSEPGRGPSPSISPRTKSTNGPAAADITSIKFSTSSMGSNPAKNVAGMFSNINVQNYTSTSKVLAFSADGTAIKETSTDITENGKKVSSSERFTATVDPSDFTALAKVFAENDFANEPDSRDITSLPIKNILTITYRDGTKVINTGHMGKDTPETTAMLNAIKDLEKKAGWVAAN